MNFDDFLSGRVKTARYFNRFIYLLVGNISETVQQHRDKANQNNMSDSESMLSTSFIPPDRNEENRLRAWTFKSWQWFLFSSDVLHIHGCYHQKTKQRFIRCSGKFWLSLLLGLSCLSTMCESIACNSNEECEELLRKGSECLEGSCTNPYANGGCLKNHLPHEFQKLRTCNSEDSADVIEHGGFCRPSEFDYMEIRMGSQNWEGAFFVVWILQVLLSELLDVPVSVETGVRGKTLNFYHLYSAMDYGSSNRFDGFETAVDIGGDCRNVKQNISDDYILCTHIIPEVWSESKHGAIHAAKKAGIIETPLSLGALGEVGWHIPAFTAEKDPTLLHFLGLIGEENRKKLADRFLRPTSWKEYCQEVSSNYCETNDGIATRAPYNPGEWDSYYKEGFYKGHFRKTEENDCEKNPTTCTGHIVDFPCGWSSFAKATAHHLNIAVESNGPDSPDSVQGYSYSQMTQIWAAANATKSDVLLQWWTPEALYQSYAGTESEFLRITLTPPTQTCIENRVELLDRCNSNETAQLGDPRGACDETPTVLKKLIVGNLFENTEGPDIPEALHSPAYQALKAFSISDLQVNDIFTSWLAKGRDKWNFDPREATCEWIVENLNYTKSFVPRSHPRVIEMSTDLQVSFYVAITISSLALILCFISMYMTFQFRRRKAIRYAQLEFLALLLIGLFLVSLGGLVKALEPLTSACTAVVWLINMGYTLELVPLMIKMAAINRLMNAARRMKKFELNRRSLFIAVVLINATVFGVLVVWTVLDPPKKTVGYTLSHHSANTTVHGAVVTLDYFCDSSNGFWNIMSLGWQSLLLLCGTVLAFQTRDVREELNETQTLAMMIYSHFVFVVLRGIMFFLENSLRRSDFEAIQSINYSTDAIGVLVIYFLPKFLIVARKDGDQQPWQRASIHHSRMTNSSYRPRNLSSDDMSFG